MTGLNLLMDYHNLQDRRTLNSLNQVNETTGENTRNSFQMMDSTLTENKSEDQENESKITGDNTSSNSNQISHIIQEVHQIIEEVVLHIPINDDIISDEDFEFMHVIIHFRRENMERADSNEELIQILLRNGILKTAQVENAFRDLPRTLFFPNLYVVMHPCIMYPTPIPYGFGFNISSPLCHTLALENLELDNAHSFLDIGSGCGLITIMASYLMDSSSISHGIDRHTEVVEFSLLNLENSLMHLKINDKKKLGQVEFFEHNILLDKPHQRLLKKYDRIHSSVCCSDLQIELLASYLELSGIIIQTPQNEQVLKIGKKELAQGLTVLTREIIMEGVMYSDIIEPTEIEVNNWNEKLQKTFLEKKADFLFLHILLKELEKKYFFQIPDVIISVLIDYLHY